MVIPSLLPDELLVSGIARLARWNGFDNFTELPAHWVGADFKVSFIEGSLNLPEFCNRLQAILGNAESTLQRFTTLAARRWLGEIEQRYWHALIQGQVRTTLGELTFHKHSELYFCEICRAEDIEQYGFTYWHRIHQVPVLDRCPIHETLLIQAKLNRRDLHSFLPFPSDISPSQTVTKPSCDLNISFRKKLEILIYELLNSPYPMLSSPDSLIYQGLRQYFLLNANGEIRQSDLRMFLHLRMASNTNEVYMMEYINQIIRCIKKHSRCIVFGRAILFCSFFENIKASLVVKDWVEVIGGAIGILKDSVKLDQMDVLIKHREECLKYLGDCPFPTRLDFTQKHYRKFTWLLKHDSAWLDLHMPNSRNLWRQIPLL